jgi:hypothetical protein
MRRLKPTLKSSLILMFLMFLGINVTTSIVISSWKKEKDLNPPSEKSQLAKEKDLIILGRSWASMKKDLREGRTVTEPTSIDRREAAKLALEQTAAMIKYMFAAAAGFLGFLAKFLIDSQLKEDRVSLPAASLLMSAAAVLCFLSSMFGGIIAQGWFTRLATLTQFSLIREFGVWVLYQQLFVFLGVLFAVFSAIPLVIDSPTRR